MKSLKNKWIIVIAAIIILSILFLEMKPWQVCHSMVMTTSQETEIELHVLMNTLLPVNQAELENEVILENKKINGWDEDCKFTVVFYRSKFHYRIGKRAGK